MSEFTTIVLKCYEATWLFIHSYCSVIRLAVVSSAHCRSNLNLTNKTVKCMQKLDFFSRQTELTIVFYAFVGVPLCINYYALIFLVLGHLFSKSPGALIWSVDCLKNWGVDIWKIARATMYSPVTIKPLNVWKLNGNRAYGILKC